MSNEIKDRTVYMLYRAGKVNVNGNDIYIGSTSQSLRDRLSQHRYKAKRIRTKSNRLYKRMNEVGLQNWKILPLITFACDTKTILEFERDWINVLQADLNIKLPIRRECTTREYHATYREANKGKIHNHFKCIVRSKRYYCNTCNIACWCKRDLDRHLDTLSHFTAYVNFVD